MSLQQGPGPSRPRRPQLPGRAERAPAPGPRVRRVPPHPSAQLPGQLDGKGRASCRRLQIGQLPAPFAPGPTRGADGSAWRPEPGRRPRTPPTRGSPAPGLARRRFSPDN